jgi:hypothetical protein
MYRHVRAARPQGDVPVHRARPAGVDRAVQLARRGAGDRSTTASAAGSSRPRPGSPPTSPRWCAGRVPLGASTHYARADGREIPLSVHVPPVAGRAPGRRPHPRDHQARLRGVRGALRPWPTRSATTTRCSCPSSTSGAMENAGCGDLPRRVHLPLPADRRAYEARDNTILHEMAHMWFGDLVTMTLVGRPVAQRVLRRVGVPLRQDEIRAKYGDRAQPVGDLLQQPQDVGLPPGPASHHPPDRRRHGRPGGGRAELRRHHLRQGRLGAAAARRLRRQGRTSSPGVRAYFAKHAFGNTQLPDLLAELEVASGPRPVLLHQPVAADGGREHASPPTGTRRTANSPGSASGSGPPRSGRPCAGSGSRSASTTSSTGRWYAPSGSSSTSTASTPRCPSSSDARRPDLLLLNDDDLTYAKIRLDRAVAGDAGGARPPASTTNWPAHWPGAPRGTSPATAR